ARSRSCRKCAQLVFARHSLFSRWAKMSVRSQHKVPLTPIDLGFLVIIFLVMTQLYRVVGVMIGLESVMPITVGITIACALYLFLKGKLLTKTIHHYGFISFAMLTPMGTALYADAVDFRALAMQVHY